MRRLTDRPAAAGVRRTSARTKEPPASRWALDESAAAATVAAEAARAPGGEQALAARIALHAAARPANHSALPVGWALVLAAAAAAPACSLRCSSGACPCVRAPISAAGASAGVRTPPCPSRHRLRMPLRRAAPAPVWQPAAAVLAIQEPAQQSQALSAVPGQEAPLARRPWRPLQAERPQEAQRWAWQERVRQLLCRTRLARRRRVLRPLPRRARAPVRTPA